MTAYSSCLLSALAALVVVTGAGQPPPERRDAQSAYEPRSGPGVGQKFLEQFVGDWDVAKAFYPPSGEPVRMNGVCRQTMIHGGRFLKSEFVFERNGTKTTGLGLIGFDTRAGTFTSVWTDSRQTRMSIRQSEGPFNGEEIVLLSRSLEASGQGPPRSRTVTRLADHGHKIVHRQYARSREGKERLMMELILTRKGEAPAR